MRLFLRNRIPVSLLILLLFAGICLAQDSPSFQGEATGNDINIRSDSTVNSEIICTLKKGQRLEVVSGLYEWYKIRLPKTAPSYIKKSLTSCISYAANLLDGGAAQTTANRCISAKATKDRINIRLRPSESSPILGIADKNEVMDVIGESGDWYKIRPMQNSFGWVHKNLVKKISSTAGDMKTPGQEGEEKTKLASGGNASSQYNISLEGTIKPKFIKKIATHKLITADNEVFLLKGDEASLNALNYKRAKIIGRKTGPSASGYTLIEIKIIEVMN